MSVEENKELVRRFFTGPGEIFIRQALKTENPTAVITERVRQDFSKILTPDFIVHAWGVDVKLEENIQVNVMMCLGMPDVNFPIKHIVAEGDYVAVFFTYRGTHEGPFMSPAGIIQATGNKINCNGVYFCRCDKGKIAEVWACYDSLTMMQQLGVIPKQ